MVHRQTSSRLGAVYVLIGALLLESALFVPWYFYDGQAVQLAGSQASPIGVRDTAFSLTSVPGIAVVQATCPLFEPFAPEGGLPGLCPISTSFSGAGFNSVGHVAEPTFALAAAGAAIAAVGGILGLILANAPRRRFPELILAVVAVALGIAATATFAVLLPTAFAHDIPASQRGNPNGLWFMPSGPWSSFIGSATWTMHGECPLSGCPAITASWGPGIGWALAVAASVVLLEGAVMMYRFRHDASGSPSPSASTRPKRASNPPNSTA